MEIKDIQEISVHSLKTSCCYTGSLLNDSQELKISFFKEKLLRKALEKHKKIVPCGTRCFQIKNQELLFWFNDELISSTTKILSEFLDEPILPVREI